VDGWVVQIDNWHKMIITGYFDESGTHKGAAVSVMAGFVGDSRNWRKFEKRASKLFARFQVDIYHTIDLKRSDKDFSGWSINRKIEFIDEFHHIINETVEIGFSSLLREDDYNYYLNLPWPKNAQVRKDSKYGILFRASFAAILDSVMRVPNWQRMQEPQLKIVIEDGHRNVGDLNRIYERVKSTFENSKAMAGLKFQGKAGCLPLAAADLFAYSVFGSETGSKPIGTATRPSKSDVSYRGNMHRIFIDRPTLLLLNEQAIHLSAGGSISEFNKRL
jgi:hypothetical protein